MSDDLEMLKRKRQEAVERAGVLQAEVSYLTRERNEALERSKALEEALHIIAERRCERYIKGSCVDDKSLTRRAAYTAHCWCHPCIARAALERSK